MPRKKQVIPKFENEEAEALWWETHKSQIEADFRKSVRNGAKLGIEDVLARVKRNTALQPVTIRLVGEDIQKARELAHDKGIGYQTYIRLLIHEALRKENSHVSPQGKKRSAE
jgi:predicted DNA binding CopG/RHH family protein